ncbi:hypothetical protein [Alteromonas lipolytica]|uniref:Uncharacterized protein n=1 Tax=Alteromonas lipolytica TaxID=1856405 RepID=A0A1E8FJ59_9ALTE|nr:hypothetical protein [Alteromonas lipolytica]OFI35979.1 hypothetical protein BFC17_09890 [Alteromonas lipolytica]GGF71963.1 hypothetical protein GCM10011338_25250 [Alteromonas lipolytica]
MCKKLFLLFLICISEALAVEVQPDEIYPPGTEVEVSSLGVGFTIPAGWRGGWPSGTGAFVLDNQQGNASIMMIFDQFSSAQIASMMAENIPLDENIYLAPQSLPATKSDYYENHYQVVGSVVPLGAFIAAKEVREGLSLATILMASEIGQDQQHVVVQLTSGLRLFTPVQPEADPNATSWQDYMRGRYIARYYTGSGYREKQELWLCSDGSFASSFNAGGFSMDGFSGAMDDSNSGQWEASGSTNQPGTLRLNYANGAQSVIQLQLQDKLYLDGVQWLRGDNERCQ